MDQPGGFLTQADAVVEPFHLPKVQHSSYVPPPAGTGVEISQIKENAEKSEMENADIIQDTDEDDVTHLAVPAEPQTSYRRLGNPMTMRELAEIAETKAREVTTSSTVFSNEVNGDSGPKRMKSPKLSKREKPKAKRRRRRSSLSSVSVSSEEAGFKASTSKRSKRAPSPPLAKSTRVLRPRVPKNKEQNTEDEEVEDASYQKSARSYKR